MTNCICVINWFRLKSLFFILFYKTFFLHNVNYLTPSAHLYFFSFLSYETWVQLHASFHQHHVLLPKSHCSPALPRRQPIGTRSNVSTLSLHDKPHFIVFLGWKQKLCVQNGRHMQYKNMIFLQEHKKKKKHVLAHSKKKKNCTAFIQYFIHGKKYKYIYMYTSVVAIAVPIQKCRDVFYI